LEERIMKKIVPLITLAAASVGFIGGYTKNRRTQTNNTFNTALSMDLNSLETRKLPDDIFNINYSGVLRSNLFVEARVSERHETFIGSGAKSTDIIDGTLVTDQARGGLRYWAATFCGVVACWVRQRAGV